MQVSITGVQETATFEAGPVLTELVCKVLIVRANGARPNEGPGNVAIRGAVRADFIGRLTMAMRAEEQSVIQTSEGIEKLKGEALSALGQSLVVERLESETDQAYRIRLHEANDLETKPIRAQIQAAGDAMVESLLGPGPVSQQLGISIEVLES